MGAGRPPKTGLSYHGSDVDFYGDYKIIDLLDRYGPLGITIYDVIIKMVYRSGYYLEIPMNQLALSVTRTIGNKWIKNKNLVLQVVYYCAEIGLFDDALLRQNIITSAGIQKRYSLATVRNKVKIEKYRLLEEESEKPLLNAPKNRISATENGINVTEIRNTDANIPIKEIKGNTIYTIEFSSEIESRFQRYLVIRQGHYGPISQEQIQELREELYSLSQDPKEQDAILRKAASAGYKTFYDVDKKKSGKEKSSNPKKSQFNNFSGREYDMSELERKLLEGGG